MCDKTHIYWYMEAHRGTKNHTKTPQMWGFFYDGFRFSIASVRSSSVVNA